MNEPMPVDREWLNNRWRLLLIALQSTIPALAPVLLLRRILPGMALGWLPPLLLAAALEGVWTTHWLGYPQFRRKRTLAFRLGEFLTFVIALRLLTWATVIGWPTWETVYGWLISPALFFDLPFAGGIVLLALAWGEAVTLAGLFGHMALQPDELLATERDRWAERTPAFASRADLAAAITDHWLVGAFLLVIVTGLSRFTLRLGETVRFGVRTLSLPGEFVSLLLFYFVGGLFLIGEARRGALRAQWHFEGTRWQSDLQPRWRRIAVGILLLAALVAGLIPFGSADPLAPLAESVLILLAQMGYLIMSIFLLLMSLLISLLPFARVREPLAPPPEIPPPRQSDHAAHILPPWFGGAIVWFVVLVLVALAIRVYWRERGISLSWSCLRRWWKAFLSWWKGRPARVRHLMRRGMARARRGVRLPAMPSLPAMPLPLLPWRRLTPDQWVRYYYLSALKRAHRAGHPRHPAQTPEEYEGALLSERPDLTGAAKALTTAFERARYAGHPFHPEEVDAVRQAWEQFKKDIARQAGGKTS